MITVGVTPFASCPHMVEGIFVSGLLALISYCFYRDQVLYLNGMFLRTGMVRVAR